MSVVCGTDFSEGAATAARVAATWARRSGETLVLATAVERPVAVAAESGASMVVTGDIEERVADYGLHQAAARLDVPGVDIHTRALHGAPAPALAALGRELGASLLVVGSHGRGRLGRFFLGSTADRLLHVADRPVLVVRGRADALVAWTLGLRPLRVVAGLDFEPCSRRAVRALGVLRRMGPCEITVVHVYDAPSTYDRLGFHDLGRLASAEVEAAAVLRRDLEALVGDLPGEGGLKIRVQPGWGRPAALLAALVEEAHPDLLVCGTHGRRGLSRLRRGSVAESLVRRTRAALLCVSRCEGASDVPPGPSA